MAVYRWCPPILICRSLLMLVTLKHGLSSTMSEYEIKFKLSFLIAKNHQSKQRDWDWNDSLLLPQQTLACSDGTGMLYIMLPLHCTTWKITGRHRDIVMQTREFIIIWTGTRMMSNGSWAKGHESFKLLLHASWYPNRTWIVQLTWVPVAGDVLYRGGILSWR
jgi:hypothetical protein